MMSDKEKYKALMQRYWEAGTSPEEEKELAYYVAHVDDPEFDEIRGVLGYLSVGRSKRRLRSRKLRMYSSIAAAASIVAILAVSMYFTPGRNSRTGDIRVSYAYGVKSTDGETIMASVESSLADFFAGDTPAETQLIEMFQR